MNNQENTTIEGRGNVHVVTLIQTIRIILIDELKSVIYNHKGSAYIKFINLAVGIEYLGACLDDYPFDCENQSEKRFNSALKKLFDKRYEKYSKKGSDIYFYKDFRCAFVHQLRPTNKIVLTHRSEAEIEGTKHLSPIQTGEIVLVLEDFYDDFERGASRLIRKFQDGEITNLKGDKGFIKFVSIKGNLTNEKDNV